MTQDSFWKKNPELMMIRANELGRLVEHLEAEQRDGPWRKGTFLAIPVPLSLAVEIGLKAWHRKEGNDAPVKTHDLLELYDGLGDSARRRLEEKMPEVPGVIPDWPAYPGIRHALRQNRISSRSGDTRMNTMPCMQKQVSSRWHSRQLSTHTSSRCLRTAALRVRPLRPWPASTRGRYVSVAADSRYRSATSRADCARARSVSAEGCIPVIPASS